MSVKKEKALRLKTIKGDFKKNKSLYLLMLPVLLYFIIFKYVPMYGALIAFQDFSPKRGFIGSDFVGLKHFIDFFTSPSFGTLLKNTFRISLTSLVFGFPAPIILALLLNELRNKKLARVIQNFTYLPHFISLVIVCGLIHDFTKDTGLIGSLVGRMVGEPVSLLHFPEYFVPTYVISGIWQEVGWGAIIYLGALTAIDQDLYEAASIDGAGRLRKLLSITLPGIVPTIVIMLILRMGSILGVGHEKIILLYNDVNRSVSDVISSYVYRRGILNSDWSFSAAVGIFNSVIGLTFVVTANAINRRLTETSLW